MTNWQDTATTACSYSIFRCIRYKYNALVLDANTLKRREKNRTRNLLLKNELRMRTSGVRAKVDLEIFYKEHSNMHNCTSTFWVPRASMKEFPSVVTMQ